MSHVHGGRVRKTPGVTRRGRHPSRGCCFKLDVLQCCRVVVIQPALSELLQRQKKGFNLFGAYATAAPQAEIGWHQAKANLHIYAAV